MGVFPRTPVGGVAWLSLEPVVGGGAAAGGGNWGILDAAAYYYWNDIRARRFYRVAKSSYVGMLPAMLAAACWV